MGRWEPDAAGRLREAALELFAANGFEQTTVAQIAARAGLTERTFFRHFADKREVLFQGSERLRDILVDAVEGAPETAAPLDAVVAAVEAAGAAFVREFASRRQAVILANPELQERELIKLDSLASGLAGALRQRSANEQTARLAGETGLAIFRVTFQRWVTDTHERAWSEHLRDTIAELGGLLHEAHTPTATSRVAAR